MRAWLEARPYATVGLVGLICLLVIVVGTSSCGGGVPGNGNGNDGRKTKYDNVRVQKIALTDSEGGGFVLCISDFADGAGLALSCDFSQAGKPR